MFFQVSGATREAKQIDAKLKIYHDCADGVRVSLRDDATRRSSNCSLANEKFLFAYRLSIIQTARRRPPFGLTSAR